MQIKVGDYEFTEVWDGVLYKKLSRYPEISAWEMRTLIEFSEYEKNNDRECAVFCEDASLLNTIRKGMRNKAAYAAVPPPELITECTACPYRKGCVTEYVCHTSSVEDAKKIFSCGSLLSAVKARGLSGETLMLEKRNAAKDPADYFDYVMFSWGNCQAGDRLVMERSLGRFPDETDLNAGFHPGVRFYFRYDTLKEHPRRVFDGVLPMKIKDGILLSEWVHRIVIPEEAKPVLENIVPVALKNRVLYVRNDCKDIWDWSEKVYRLIETG